MSRDLNTNSIIKQLGMTIGSLLVMGSILIFTTSNWDSWSNVERSTLFFSLALISLLAFSALFRIRRTRATFQSLIATLTTLLIVGGIAVLDPGGENSLISIAAGLLAAVVMHSILRTFITKIALFVYFLILGISAIQVLMSETDQSSLIQSVFIAVVGGSLLAESRLSNSDFLGNGVLGSATVLFSSQLMIRSNHEYLAFLTLGIFSVFMLSVYLSSASLLSIIGLLISLPLLAGQITRVVFNDESQSSFGYFVAGVTLIIVVLLLFRVGRKARLPLQD